MVGSAQETGNRGRQSPLETEFLAGRLERLKATGCNILVTGAVSPAVTYHATRNLFGVEEHGVTRERILAVTDLRPPDSHYLRTGYRRPPQLVTSDGLERGSTTQDSPLTASPSIPATAWVETFQRHLCETIADVDGVVGGLEPAQLRLSLLTLRPLVEHPHTAVLDRFLRVMTTIVTGVDGMAQYHLPIGSEDPAIEAILDHFDAWMELRHRPSVGAQSRWRFPDVAHTTEWYTL